MREKNNAHSLSHIVSEKKKKREKNSVSRVKRGLNPQHITLFLCLVSLAFLAPTISLLYLARTVYEITKASSSLPNDNSANEKLSSTTTHSV